MRIWFVHFLLGISAGLPYLLTGSTLQAWMTESHVNLKTIGLFALVRLPYNFKFLWAPFIDRFSFPLLTRRRGWMIFFQALLAIALVILGLSDPVSSPFKIALFAVIVAFLSSSQDIVIDGYRTESLNGNLLGMATSSYITGYRVGMLIAGAFSMYVVGKFNFNWSSVYALMAVFMSIGAFAALIAPETEVAVVPKTLKEAVVEPFIEFFQRKEALWLLVFILFFKFGDNLAGALTTPFILQHGYTLEESAYVGKGAGFFAVLAGGFVGGPIMLKLGMIRSLWVFGLGQAIAVAGFAWLASIGHNMIALTAVIVSENFFIGCGAAAFSAFLSGLTNKRFSATQYALLTSLMAVSSTLLSAPSGWLAEQLGWVGYFSFCAGLAIPGLLLILKIRKITNI